MTIRELIQAAGEHSFVLLALFVAPPVAAWVGGQLHGPGGGGKSPWRYLYSVLVYLACVPGIVAAVLTGYALFFTNENLLDVNPLVYFLPIASMVATLVFISKNVSFDDVPGFDRLSGLMVMIGVSFAIALAIHRTRIWVVFGSSIGALFGLALFLFLLLKWGAYMLFRRAGEPKTPPPPLPHP